MNFYNITKIFPFFQIKILYFQYAKVWLPAMPTTRLSSSLTTHTAANSLNFSKNMPSCNPEKLLCEICGKGFHHAAVLGRHRSLHKKDKVPAKPLIVAKTFPCKDCGKVFKTTRTFGCHRCSQACNRTGSKGLKYEAGDGAGDFLKQRLDAKFSIPVLSVQNTSNVSENNIQSIKEITANKSATLIGIRSKSSRRAQHKNGSEISTVCSRELKPLVADIDVKSPRGQRSCTKMSPSGKGGTKMADAKNFQSDLVSNSALSSQSPSKKGCKTPENIQNDLIEYSGLKSEKKKKGRKPGLPKTCKICHKNFSSPSKFQKHAMLHDPSKPYGCDVCGKFFDDARFVKTHRTLHEKKSRKECDVCGKVFNERIFYEIHCLTHVEQKPFRCDICEDIFKDKSTFLRHCGGHKARTRKVAERFLSMKEVLKQKLEDSNRQS